MQAMTRREFTSRGLRIAVSGALLASLPPLSGCDWVQDVANWTADGEAAIGSLASILAANGVAVAPAPLAAVNAALAAVHQAAESYLAMSPAPSGALATLEAALQDCSAALGAFLTALGLPGGALLTLVTSLGEFLLSTIAGFVQKAAAAASGSAPAAAALSLRVGAAQWPVTPQWRSNRAFKRGWNAILDRTKPISSQHKLRVPIEAYQHVSFWERF